ncbi:MAG: hypothetical protein H6988_11620 [Pseudomonadales bacterium]|nr:hypothetical protein [Pseudomonadales bacterium]
MPNAATRPEYIPTQIWEAAAYLLREWDPAIAKNWIRNLERLLYGTGQDADGRLFSAALEPTWQRITLAVESNPKGYDKLEPYRVLLHVLAVFPEDLDANMKPALQDAKHRAERISFHARALADELEAFNRLRNAKGMNLGTSEYELLVAWTDAAECKITIQYSHRFPELHALLHRLADAMDEPLISPAHGHQYAVQGDGGVAGKGDVSALVRLFDTVIDDIKHYSLPPDFDFTDTDLARVLSALLQRPVSRFAVNQARKRTKSQETAW